MSLPSPLVVIYVLIYLFHKGVNQQTPVNSEEFLKCKLTPNGLEYQGTVSNSRPTLNQHHHKVLGDECIFWNSPQVSQAIDVSKLSFPEGNIREAKKFCRNPDNSQEPWCFNKKLEKKPCEIQFCHSPDCRLSGRGVEYSGKIDKTVYDNVCKLWLSSDIPKHYIGSHFPEGHPSKAYNFCRNPTNDPEGPYCFVSDIEKALENNDTTVLKEYCHVPMCDFIKTGLYSPGNVPPAEEFTAQEISLVHGTTSDNFYTHFTSCYSEDKELHFDVRLWSPGELYTGEIKLVISVLPVPVTKENLKKWDIGFEIVLQTKKSGLSSSEDDTADWKRAPNILMGTNWVNLTLQWNFGFISLKRRGEAFEKLEPIFSHTYIRDKGSLIGEHKSEKFYYSLQGSGVLFYHNSTFKPENKTCEEHITNREDYIRFFPFVHELGSRVMDFYLKSSGNCSLLFVMVPMQSNIPEMKLLLKENNDNLFILNVPGEPQKVLSSFQSHNLLSREKWTHFNIRIIKERFQLMVDTLQGFQILFDVVNIHANIFEWFSVGSNTTAQWTFMCDPNETEAKISMNKDECSVSSTGKGYKGHIWITKNGQTCLPWISKYSKNKIFETDENAIEAINYCRNIDNDKNGAFCYIYDINKSMTIVKDYCHLPECEDCRKSGTGTDYDGTKSETISHRICQEWDSNKPHQIPSSLQKKDLFPERDMKIVKNYCRDPNSDIAGPWCYTSDPLVPYEPCSVPDCDRPKACNIFLMKNTKSEKFSFKKILLGPSLRQYGFQFWLKRWNPKNAAGLSLKLSETVVASRYFEILIGEKNSSVVSFHYINETDQKSLLERKNIEQIVRAGIWTGFKLVVKLGQMKLFLEEVPHAVLSWDYFNETDIVPFQPYYAAYDLIDEGPLAVSMNCKDNFPEIYNTTKAEEVFYVFNIWKEERMSLEHNITFFFRGNGRFTLKFYNLPSMGFDLKIDINYGKNNEMVLVKEILDGKLKEISRRSADKNSFILNDSWTNITIHFSEEGGELHRNSSIFLTWTNSKLLNYFYFSLEVDGILMWIANSQYPEIGGPGVDGAWTEWGPWACSRSCGGGLGTRRRQCSQPQPSFFGELCPGEDRMSGPCNEFDCGRISPTTLHIIEERLKRYAFNLALNENDEAHIKCHQDILAQIKEESPKSKIYWYKNENELGSSKINEIDPSRFELKLTNVRINDTGTYLCGARLENSFKVIQFTSVIIKSDKPSITLRTGKKFNFDCKSLQIGSIYGNLLQRYYLNGVLWKEYSMGHRSDSIHEEIIEVNMNLSGVWECRLHQKELNASWTTNWVYLKVLSRNSFFGWLFERGQSKGFDPRIGLFIFIGFMLIVTMLALYIAFSLWLPDPSKNYTGVPSNTDDEVESQFLESGRS